MSFQLPRFFLFLSVSLWAFFPLGAIDLIQLTDSSVGAEDSFEYYLDESGKAEFAEMRAAAEKGKFISANIRSLGYTNASVWVRFRTNNSSDRQVRWILEHPFPNADLVEFYDVKKGETAFYKAGDSLPFRIRPVQYRNPAFPSVLLPRGEKYVYLKIRSNSVIHLSFRQYTAVGFYKKVLYEQFLFGLFFGSMLILAFYNFLLFVSTRDGNYLFFAAYIVALSFFQFVLEGFGFQVLWPEASGEWTSRSSWIFLWVSLALMSLFAGSYLDLGGNWGTLWNRLSRYSGILLWCYAPLSLFIPVKTGILLGFFCSFPATALIFIGGIRNVFLNQGSSLYFLSAWVVLVGGAFLYLFFPVGGLQDYGLTFWVVEAASLLHVVLMGLGLADRVKVLSGVFSDKIRELESTKLTAEQSEKRFRNLFEESEEFLFTMDTTGNIHSANKSVGRLLGFTPEEVIGWNFLDLIFVSSGEEIYDSVSETGGASGLAQGSYSKILAKEKIEDLLRTGKSPEFTVEFRQKFVLEPRQIRVRLQLLDSGENKGILGKAYELNEDVLAKFIVSESMHFTLNNYLRNADLLSRLLTVNLSSFVGTEVVIAIRTCIREIIINSIEHGNLAISFDEKTEALNEGRYLEFIQKRQREPFYNLRTVKVSYSLNARRIGFLITDEGEGFDYKKILNLDIQKLNETSLTHGRGIVMTRRVFDIVKFNDKGNKVLLIKYLKKPLRYKREKTSFDV
ncbi:7TM diverse intracellular signaling domain-containing protein [Leptospira ellisii]|uniref:7TM diverse intracellular signaling domain-containing protein n=1 Tax=Leptospira ellisii TaxID=2023197 RepID=A0A2N0BE28_9LEPT|nr:7TM diverse intracellular signaling domain-containing protein [Leptospira ellisii]MDV6235197.1 7TM diverse intracellular signaling domain-containing protein [Leptospira ellisii]PJZ94822.1 signaling protein [Leptospira ellisii]PKA04928.1 signaling protein [Leptospira ellisii]